jgi:hypothetical protein
VKYDVLTAAGVHSSHGATKQTVPHDPIKKKAMVAIHEKALP